VQAADRFPSAPAPRAAAARVCWNRVASAEVESTATHIREDKREGVERDGQSPHVRLHAGFLERSDLDEVCRRLRLVAPG
jgi:hypothetical protein